MIKWNAWLITTALFLAVRGAGAAPAIVSAPRNTAPLTQQDRLYATRLVASLDQLGAALDTFAHLTSSPKMTNGQWQQDSSWQAKMASALLQMHQCAVRENTLRPTPRFQASNQLYLASLSDFDYLYRTFPGAIQHHDDALESKCADHLVSGTQHLRAERLVFLAAANLK